jgi:hypothetical protein
MVYEIIIDVMEILYLIIKIILQFTLTLYYKFTHKMQSFHTQNKHEPDYFFVSDLPPKMFSNWNFNPMSHSPSSIVSWYVLEVDAHPISTSLQYILTPHADAENYKDYIRGQLSQHISETQMEDVINCIKFVHQNQISICSVERNTANKIVFCVIQINRHTRLVQINIYTE